MRRPRLLPALAVATAACALAFSAASSPLAVAKAISPTGCPTGQVREHETSVQAAALGLTSVCVPALHPEGRDDLMAAATQLRMRHDGVYPVMPQAYGAAQAQAAAIPAAMGADAATWQPVGKGPEIFDDPEYGEVNGEGLHTASGRIQGFDYDTSNPRRWFAAVAYGGVYETTDAGAHWHSIGDGLPTQIAGNLAYDSKSHTLIVGTGDPAYGGSSIAGLGVYRTTNDGKTWTHSSGVPSGTLTFRIAFDPNNSKIVFAATGMGLWRSSNGGVSFTNVKLPTGCTAITKPTCFFANMVTDVIVRGGTDKGAGQVLAAVGWRAGTKPDAQGLPQAPANGLYYSKTGAPGTFVYRSNPAGFAANKYVGRTALGIAHGLHQNHNYVYALVQDAEKFNGNVTTGDLPNPGAPSNTVLNGIYGSKDFGKTWVKMADADQLKSPATGSALDGPLGATYSPGIQAWYNEWIDVDPTTVADQSGTPTRLLFGLEEVWKGSAAIPAVPLTTQFQVVGQYFAGHTCAGLSLTINGYCPTNAKPTQPVSQYTTHPDQHAEMFVPDGRGGVTLVVGNDGGAYKQHIALGGDFDNYHWGPGINLGLQTLLPYYASIAKDGTVVAGLQDNGNIKITPAGKVIATYGGDGFFSFVDPNNSNIQYEEYTGGDMSVSTDGGRTWTDINPVLTGALFSTPFMMDPTNSNHLVTGGREIVETLRGPGTTSNTVDPNTRTALDNQSWVKVFDLGTAQHPGDPTAGRVTVPGVTSQASPTTKDVDLRESAINTIGNATYVGYCGYCDIVTEGVPFKSGIATNVGGSQPGRQGTPSGWHIAKAIGLPNRIVNSVVIDPKDPKTVYVTLGGYARRWIPPGSLGDDVSKVGSGHLFVSHDAGAHFTNISNNLPDIAANWSALHNGQLIVATDLGVYVGAPTKGSTFSRLGTGLPAAPVFSIAQSPRNPNEFVVATYGRGVYRIVLGSASAKSSSARAGRDTGSSSSASAAGSTGSGSKTIAARIADTARPTKPVGVLVWGVVALLGVGLVLRTRRNRQVEARVRAEGDRAPRRH